VPFYVKVHNHASYEALKGDGDIFVAGKIKAGSSVQVAFVCLDEDCTSAAGDVLEFQSFTAPADVPGVTFSMGRVKGSGAAGGAKKFSSQQMTHRGGIGLCSTFANHPTACGHISIANDVLMPAQGALILGVVYMKAVKSLGQKFSAHVAGSNNMFETVGGICKPAELAASGSGTIGAYFKGIAPPPKPVAAAPLAAKGTAKKGKGKGLKKGKSKAAATPART